MRMPKHDDRWNDMCLSLGLVILDDNVAKIVTQENFLLGLQLQASKTHGQLLKSLCWWLVLMLPLVEALFDISHVAMQALRIHFWKVCPDLQQCWIQACTPRVAVQLGWRQDLHQGCKELWIVVSSNTVSPQRFASCRGRKLVDSVEKIDLHLLTKGRTKPQCAKSPYHACCLLNRELVARVHASSMNDSEELGRARSHHRVRTNHCSELMHPQLVSNMLNRILGQVEQSCVAAADLKLIVGCLGLQSRLPA
mmetsp:Transcript_46660/g.110966  ORF Transcript_46660/g.110966 Transcript_46660/m.110966 type:complete len:252 (-) Transcript_46660:1209-1964(-)